MKALIVVDLSSYGFKLKDVFAGKYFILGSCVASMSCDVNEILCILNFETDRRKLDLKNI